MLSSGLLQSRGRKGWRPEGNVGPGDTERRAQSGEGGEESPARVSTGDNWKRPGHLHQPVTGRCICICLYLKHARIFSFGLETMEEYPAPSTLGLRNHNLRNRFQVLKQIFLNTQDTWRPSLSCLLETFFLVLQPQNMLITGSARHSSVLDG